MWSGLTQQSHEEWIPLTLTYIYTAVAPSPGADVNAVTIIYMCHLFGFMKEWLKEGGISTDSAMIYDTEPTVQTERIFSDAECDNVAYLKDSQLGGDECVNNSMVHKTSPAYLQLFTQCITIHFLTEMGARKICNDSDFSDSGKDIMTLSSKDLLFYNFLVDTLNAENICQARNDTVTFSSRNCKFYINRRRYTRSKCSYDTPRIDNDRQLYSDCLYYRFLKSLGADSLCKGWTLVYTCSLFGFMKEWLQEGGVSSDIISDTDTSVQRENMFSDSDCEFYHYTKSSTNSVCENNSMLSVTDRNPRWLYKFTECITYHFMTEIGATNSCSDDSVRSNINTTVKNTITLLSKDPRFYNFMVDTLILETFVKV